MQELLLQIFKCLSHENPSFVWTPSKGKSLKYELRTENLLQLQQCRYKKKYKHIWKQITSSQISSILKSTLPNTMKNAS